jgi:hypothetical protein
MTYPTKDENLLEGAALLMERLRTNSDVNVSIFERIVNAAQMQINARSNVSIEDQIPDVYHNVMNQVNEGNNEQ